MRKSGESSADRQSQALIDLRVSLKSLRNDLGLLAADTSQDDTGLAPRLRGLAEKVDEVETLAERAAAKFAELDRLVETDQVTGLLNQRGLRRELRRAAAQVDRHGMSVGIIFADVVDFKSINDQFGHPAGDQVLAGIAGRLTSNLRATDVVARYGGDEFVGVLYSANLAQCEARARQLEVLLAGLSFSFADGGSIVRMTIGAAELKKGEAPDDALARADAAMYALRA